MNYYQAAKAHFIANHQHPVNQALHHLTTLLAILAVVAVFYDWRITLGLLVLTQIFAIGGHLLIEKNQPAAVKYPGITIVVSTLWSFEHWFGLRQLLNHWRENANS